jgi:hypothetical protein
VKALMTKGLLLCAVLLAATWLSAGDKDKPAADKMTPKVVDAGSFGIFLDGKRIGTETFKIEQRSDFSIATAEIKVDDGTTKATQTAEMQINPNGELRLYTWRATVPVREEASVEPNDQLLTEHVVDADLKKHSVPHLLPLSTVILDDNFFSQREVLLWRYLATGCAHRDNQLTCGPGKFGILVPHVHMSASATMELIGQEKVTIRGALRELNKVVLTVSDPQRLVVMNQKESDSGQWVLWVDDQYKVLKMTVPGSHIEVVRD